MNIDITEEQIKICAKQLKIPTFAKYKQALRGLGPDMKIDEFLLELMKQEIDSRRNNQIKYRLKTAGFPYQKTLDEFDFDQLNPSVSPVFLQELAACQFIQDRKNLILIGNPGRGKTHIAISLGIKACYAGYKVIFKNAATLSNELCEARDSYLFCRLERSLSSAQLLIVDELSYVSFNRQQSELLFKIISERSEKSSTIITTNLPFSRWTELFETPGMVSALVDRLTFRSYALDMNGESYRLKSAMSKGKEK